MCIQDEFKLTIERTLEEKTTSNNIRFCSLSNITQAMVNIIILSAEQDQMVAKIQKHNLIWKLLQVLLNTTPDVLNFKKINIKDRRNFRSFVGFIVHSLRFIIVCQSIDNKSLSDDSQVAIALAQVLRKFEQFKRAFPYNAPLLDSLKDDSNMILWFRHNKGDGCSLSNILLTRAFTKITSLPEEQKCGACGKKQGQDGVDLKFCSRCKKVVYCSKECQKKNYRVHKRYCLSLSAEEQEEVKDGKVIKHFN